MNEIHIKFLIAILIFFVTGIVIRFDLWLEGLDA
jgi:hypothetical protein